MNTSNSTSSYNMLMAASFKPLTNLIDRWTFDDKLEIAEKDKIKPAFGDLHAAVKQANQDQYPCAKDYHWKRQLLTWITHPIDDVIRALSVLWFASLGHFCKIDECFKENKPIEGMFRVITTPVWWPFKVMIKALVFVPFLAIQTPISLVFPYRTLFSLGVAACQETDMGPIQIRLEICKQFENSSIYPLKTKLGFKPFGITTRRMEQIFGTAITLFIL